MKEDGWSKTAKRIEAIRKILTNTIWIIVVLVVLAGIGRHLVFKGEGTIDLAVVPEVKPIAEKADWEGVDQAIRVAVEEARKSSEHFASRNLDEWFGEMMEKVDDDFLDWYFSYWTQQQIGLRGLFQYGVHYVLKNQPTAAEKLTEQIQDEFSKRVLQPPIAELRLERIVRETADHFVDQLSTSLDSVPTMYRIPRQDWDRYIEGIALLTIATEGDRGTPITLKALTGIGAGGTMLIAGQMRGLSDTLSSRVMARSAGKAASDMATRTGGKVAAKAGGRFLGPIVGIGVLTWEVWDHKKTVGENRPILRRSIEDYFGEMKIILLKDTEGGMMVTFYDLEKQVANSTGRIKRADVQSNRDLE